MSKPVRPAISTKTIVPITTHVIASPTWSPTSLNHSYGTEVSTGIWHEEAASTNNPVRKDGSRALSNYYANHIVISNSWAATQTSVPYGWFYHRSGSSPRMARFGSDPSFADIRNFFVQSVGVAVENQAKTKFLNKLNDRKGQGQIELGVVAGELRETVHETLGLLNTLYMAPRSIGNRLALAPGEIRRQLQLVERAGSKKEAMKRLSRANRVQLEGIVDAWMSYQLGIKPLVHDITDATAYLAAAVDSDPNSLTATVRAGASGDYDYHVPLVQAGLNGSAVDIDAFMKQSVKIDYSCRYKIPARPSRTEALGLDNPAFVAWNLVKYTWLVDYALGVGDWLGSLTASNNTQFIEGTMSRKRVVICDRLKSRAVPGVTLIEDPAKPAFLFDAQLFERQVLMSGVMPAAFPVTKLSLGLTQLANAVSVLKNFAR